MCVVNPILTSSCADSDGIAVLSMVFVSALLVLAERRYSRSTRIRRLDRDSARWNLDPETVQRRRNLFWEIFSADVSHVRALLGG